MSPLRTFSVALAALVLSSTGCGEVRDGFPPTETERAAALSVIDQVTSLRRLADDPTDRGVLLDAVRFDAVAALIDPNGAPVGWTQLPPGVAMPDCITASLTTATFTECDVEGHMVDGTISHAGPRLNAEVIDVFMFDAGSRNGIEGATTLDGSLSVTPRDLGTAASTVIDGAIDLDATWTHRGADYLLDAAVSFDTVVVDESGCPVGGSLTASGTVRGSGLQAARTVQFGPDCGEMTISR